MLSGLPKNYPNMKIAINGFGRIGRTTLRALASHPEVEVVAVNDLTDAATLAHLLKLDTAHGRFPGEVVAEDDAIVVNGRRIRLLSERDPQKLPWTKLGIDVVV